MRTDDTTCSIIILNDNPNKLVIGTSDVQPSALEAGQDMSTSATNGIDGHTTPLGFTAPGGLVGRKVYGIASHSRYSKLADNTITIPCSSQDTVPAMTTLFASHETNANLKELLVPNEVIE